MATDGLPDELFARRPGTTRTTLLARLRDPEDRAAFAEFYRLYFRGMVAWAKPCGLSPDEAEDLVQDLFLEQLPALMREYRRPTEARQGALRAYLKGRIRFATMDRRRKRDRRDRLLRVLDHPAESEDPTWVDHDIQALRIAWSRVRDEYRRKGESWKPLVAWIRSFGLRAPVPREKPEDAGFGRSCPSSAETALHLQRLGHAACRDHDDVDQAMFQVRKAFRRHLESLLPPDPGR